MKSYIEHNQVRERWLEEKFSYANGTFLNLILNDCPNVQTALDLGMGNGRLVKLLRHNGIRAYGVDLRGIVHKGLITANAEVLPFRDTSFDVVTESMLFSDFKELQDSPTESYDRVIKEAERVLKPGGSFFTESGFRYDVWKYFKEGIRVRYGDYRWFRK